MKTIPVTQRQNTYELLVSQAFATETGVRCMVGWQRNPAIDCRTVFVAEVDAKGAYMMDMHGCDAIGWTELPRAEVVGMIEAFEKNYAELGRAKADISPRRAFSAFLSGAGLLECIPEAA